VPPRRETTLRNFVVTAIVAVVGSLAVSLAEVALRPYREAQQDLDRVRQVLEAAGAYDPEVPLERTAQRGESRIVDLETGEYVPEGEYDPNAGSLLDPDADPAGVEKRERHARVWIVRDAGAISAIVLPVRGAGWSMLHGLVGLDRDLQTIRGLTFTKHDETAGMGAEVDDPKWKAQWPGTRAFDEGGAVRLRVVKPGTNVPGADPASVVDGSSGATLTTEGVDALLRFWLGDRGFGPYLDRLRREGVDDE